MNAQEKKDKTAEETIAKLYAGSVRRWNALLAEKDRIEREMKSELMKTDEAVEKAQAEYGKAEGITAGMEALFSVKNFEAYWIALLQEAGNQVVRKVIMQTPAGGAGSVSKKKKGKK